VIVANDGLSRVVGIGLCTSDYHSPFDKENPCGELYNYLHVRKVDWQIKQPFDVSARFFNQPTIQELKIEKIEKLGRYLKKKTSDEQFNRFEKMMKRDISVLPFEADQEPHRMSRKDEREVVTRQIRERRGQQAFRSQLLNRF
jgi:hypothetical protein